MKKLSLLVLTAVLFCVLSPRPRAEDTARMIERELGVDELELLVPDALAEDEILRDTVSAPSADAGKNGLAFEIIAEKAAALITRELRETAGSFAALLGLIILIAVFNAVKDSLNQPSLHTAFGFVSALVLCTCTYSFVLDAFTDAQEYAERINTFMTGLLPTLGTLHTVSGNPASALAQNASLLAAVKLLEELSFRILLPCLRTLFALCAAGAVSKINLSGIIGITKSIATTVCVSGFTILGAVLYFQTVLSGAADTLAMRSVRLAAGTFIPIIGSLVGEASKTVVSSLSLIKGSVGVFAAAVILFLALKPILSVAVKKLAVVLISSASKLLSCEKEAAFLDGIAGIFNILIALMISSAVYFILALAVFMKTAAA